MEGRGDLREALLRRIQSIDPWNAQQVVSAIMSRFTHERIEQYVSGLDDDLRSLIAKTKQSLKLKSEAQSPGYAADIRMDKQFQSSSRPEIGCSNAMTYLPSSREPQNIRPLSSSGFGPLGSLEMEIRNLLFMARPFSIMVDDLSWWYYELYKKHLLVIRMNQQNVMIQLDGMAYNLSSLHTIMMLADSSSYGHPYICLLEDALGYQYQDYGNGDQIYITFHAASRLTKEHIWSYFSQYGIVTNVQIPVVNNCCMFGFVRFLHCQTVNLLLSQWDPAVPHLIYAARVFVKRYKPKAERIGNEGDNAIQLLHASDGPKEVTVPEQNIFCSGENDRCPHVLCEIITLGGVQKICPGCGELLRQIMELVRMREKCLECGKLLNQITESARKSENCPRCRQLLRQIIDFVQQEKE